MIKWIKDKIIYLFFGGLILVGAILLLNTPPLGGKIVLTTIENILEKIDATVVPVDEIHTSKGKLKIENTDDNSNETFIIKSDKGSYSVKKIDGIRTLDVYFSVTNLRKSEFGNIKFLFSGNEQINSIKKYIPVKDYIDVPVYENIECINATSTPCYELIQTGTTKKEITADSWEDLVLSEDEEKTSLLKKITKGTSEKMTSFQFEKGTTFFKASVSYTDKDIRNEFFIEVFGNNGGYGLLDPTFETIAYDATSISDGYISGTTQTWSHTCTGTNRILWVWAGFPYTEGYVITGVTYSGVAMTQVGSAVLVPGNRYIGLWYLIAPATSANDIVITASETTLLMGMATSYTGAKQSGVPDSNGSATAQSVTSLTVSSTVVIENSWQVMIGRATLPDTAISAGTGTTKRNGDLIGNGIFDSNGALASGSRSLQFTWTGAQDAAGIIASFAPAPVPSTFIPQPSIY